jgi:Ca2+-binding RTX toxin-like protein
MVVPISRIPALVLLAVSAWAATLAVPDPASAARVFIGVRDAVVFVARPGEANRVEVARLPGAPDRVLIVDAAGITAGKGCTQAGAAVSCPVEVEVLASLGDRGDIFDARSGGPLSMTVSSGPGDDKVIGNGGASFVDDVVYGDEGEDRIVALGGMDFAFGGKDADRIKGGGRGDALFGGAGPDVLLGGAGPDRFQGGAGDDLAKGEEGSDRLAEIGTGTGKDRLFGGPGIDGAIFICSRCTVNLDDSAAAGSAERPDDVRAEIVRTPGGYFDQTEEEAVPFPPGEDRVTGNGEANILETGFGRDLVKGGGGKDILHAGRGPDRVLARDGERDRVACGAGTDTAIVDAADVTSGCEEAETA